MKSVKQTLFRLKFPSDTLWHILMTNQMFRCTFLKLILASARWLQAALQPVCPVLISAQRHRRPEYKVLQMEKTFWLYVISDLRNITDLHICVERGEIQPQSWKLLMRNRAQWGCDTRSERIRNRRKSLTFLLSVLKSRVYRWVQTIFRFQILNSGNYGCKV